MDCPVKLLTSFWEMGGNWRIWRKPTRGENGAKTTINNQNNIISIINQSIQQSINPQHGGFFYFYFYKIHSTSFKVKVKRGHECVSGALQGIGVHLRV